MASTSTVAIVGGGTAGLALAAELKRCGMDQVVVLEREKHAGGIPRHCGHYPFGLREYHRLLKGPTYAARNVETATRLGVDIRTQTTVSGIHPGGQLTLSTPDGMEKMQADRVVLCTGVRESSRAQRLIGGDRPLGVISTGALQSMIYLHGMQPFSRPVIFGSELVSFSAIDTCRHFDIRPVAMIEESDRIITHNIVRPYLTLRGVPLHTGITYPRIIGHEKVEAIEFVDPSGARQTIETDGIIISGKFRPEAALLRNSHLEIDPGTGGPVIDQFGQCSDPAYYCAGNLLRPAETSGWCWREGVDTARRIVQDLTGPDFTSTGSLRLVVADPAVRFALPQTLTLTERPGGMKKMQIGLNEPVNGWLKASIGDNCMSECRIVSRPVRRIQLPLTEFLTAPSGSDIRLTIKQRQ